MKTTIRPRWYSRSLVGVLVATATFLLAFQIMAPTSSVALIDIGCEEVSGCGGGEGGGWPEEGGSAEEGGGGWAEEGGSAEEGGGGSAEGGGWEEELEDQEEEELEEEETRIEEEEQQEEAEEEEKAQADQENIALERAENAKTPQQKLEELMSRCDVLYGDVVSAKIIQHQAIGGPGFIQASIQYDDAARAYEECHWDELELRDSLGLPPREPEPGPVIIAQADSAPLAQPSRPGMHSQASLGPAGSNGKARSQHAQGRPRKRSGQKVKTHH